MDKKVPKVSNLYGRARRIELVERIAYIVVGIIAVVLVVLLVSKTTEKTDDNVNFAYLRNYLEAKGFSCELLHRSGGQCNLRGKNVSYIFIRYDDGFEYIVRTKSYNFHLKHILSDEDKITFRTTSDAFSGYRNKNYTCSFKDNILNGIDKCVDEDDEVLDLEAYTGTIEQIIYDVNNIIDSSGYDKNRLISNNVWEKK